MSTPTQITIRPDSDLNIAKFPMSAKRLVGERHQFGPDTTATAQFFGEDGPGFRDLVDAINPLNHIPIVSSITESVTGHQVSAASKLIGGTLLGGPIGLFAALGNIIFEQETGHSPGGAMVAALAGDDTEAVTQLAEAETSPHLKEIETAEAATPLAPATTPVAEAIAQEKVAAALHKTQENLTLAMSQMGGDGEKLGEADAATLALFGRDTASAHRSYQNAQFRNYLSDVTTSRVL